MQIQALIELFNTDISLATEIQSLMDREFSALTERNLGELQQLLDEKQQRLSLLAQHARERSQLMNQLQLPASEEGLQTLAERTPEQGPALLDSARQLSDLIEQLQQANQRNGRVIRHNQASLNSVLSILHGSDVPNLYDSKGSTARIAQHKPLSQA